MQTEVCAFDPTTREIIVISGPYNGTKWTFTKIDVLGVNDETNQLMLDTEIRVLVCPKKYAEEFSTNDAKRLTDFNEVIVNPYLTEFVKQTMKDHNKENGGA